MIKLSKDRTSRTASFLSTLHMSVQFIVGLCTSHTFSVFYEIVYAWSKYFTDTLSLFGAWFVIVHSFFGCHFLALLRWYLSFIIWNVYFVCNKYFNYVFITILIYRCTPIFYIIKWLLIGNIIDKYNTITPFKIRRCLYLISFLTCGIKNLKFYVFAIYNCHLWFRTNT